VRGAGPHVHRAQIFYRVSCLYTVGAGVWWRVGGMGDGEGVWGMGDSVGYQLYRGSSTSRAACIEQGDG
jgi:hypothetical protein